MKPEPVGFTAEENLFQNHIGVHNNLHLTLFLFWLPLMNTISYFLACRELVYTHLNLKHIEFLHVQLLYYLVSIDPDLLGLILLLLIATQVICRFSRENQFLCHEVTLNFTPPPGI